MRVLIVSQYYSPENVRIPGDVAHALLEQGHEVRVLTGYPNYPDGKIFPGFTQRWRTKSIVRGVQILRVPLFIDHSQNASRRIWNYVSFALSSASAWSFAKQADVIYVYATQMTPAFGPWVWKMVRGVPYVLHIQDLWPESIMDSSIGASTLIKRISASFINWWLRSVYRHATEIIAIAPTMVETLRQRNAKSQSLRLVYNWAGKRDEIQIRVDVKDRDLKLGLNMLYAGNVGDMQDLETVIEATHRTANLGVKLTIVGDGVALGRIKALVARIGASNIEFKSPVPLSEMEPIYGAADYALVTLKSLPVFNGTIPSKFQAALSYGVPVISTVQGDLRQLVCALNVGLTADGENVDSLTEVLRSAALGGEPQRTKLAESAFAAYAQLFSQESGVAAISDVLLQAATNGMPGHRARASRSDEKRKKN